MPLPPWGMPLRWSPCRSWLSLLSAGPSAAYLTCETPTGQELRQLPHIAEDQRSRPAQVLGLGQAAREAEREHAGGARRLDAPPAVLDDGARGRIDAHPLGGVQEEVGGGLA